MCYFQIRTWPWEKLNNDLSSKIFQALNQSLEKMQNIICLTFKFSFITKPFNYLLCEYVISFKYNEILNFYKYNSLTHWYELQLYFSWMSLDILREGKALVVTLVKNLPPLPLLWLELWVPCFLFFPKRLPMAS